MVLASTEAQALFREQYIQIPFPSYYSLTILICTQFKAVNRCLMGPQQRWVEHQLIDLTFNKLQKNYCQNQLLINKASSIDVFLAQNIVFQLRQQLFSGQCRLVGWSGIKEFQIVIQELQKFGDMNVMRCNECNECKCMHWIYVM